MRVSNGRAKRNIKPLASRSFASWIGSVILLVCGVVVQVPRSVATLVQISYAPPKTNGDCDCQTGCEDCGDPIHIATGNVFERIVDYETSGPNKLSFIRFYNSLANPITFAFRLGTNWRSNYDRYLDLSATSVSAERADGQVLTFTQNGGSWASDSDVDVALARNGSTWTLTDSDDTVEVYSAVSAAEAILTSIQARNGYTQTLTYNASDQLTSVTDSYSRTLTFLYLNNRLVEVMTPDTLFLTFRYTSSSLGTNDLLTQVFYSTTPPASQTYLYTNSGLPFTLTDIFDERGYDYNSWTYDNHGRALTSRRGGFDLTTVSYDDTTGNRTVTGPLGQVSVYKFAMLQGVPKITEIDRQATSTTTSAQKTFTYDANGYTASVADWNGNTTQYVNDSRGQAVSITEAAGTPAARTTTIAYLSNFHLPTQIVTPGLTTNFTYDSSGDPLTRTLTDTTTTTAPYSTNGQSRTWTYTWSNSLLASILGPRTNVSELTKFTYDATGAVTSITNALGQTTRITQHLPGGFPQTIVDANGVTTNLAYDVRLRLTSSTLSTTGGPLVTSYTYDPAGDLFKLTLPDGSAITNTWDPARRLTARTDSLGNSIAYTLDAAGDRTNTTVANSVGTTTRQHAGTFDALGRLLDDVGGAGQTTVFAYDPNGNGITITDPLQRTTQQTFDALNRRIKITDPAQGNTAFSYDAHNRPLSITDPNGNPTTYTYDGFGDVIQEISPARGATVYHYDLDSNLVQKVDARGAVANYTYDPLNRVITTTYPADVAENVAYAYDQPAGGFGIGRLTSVTDSVGTLSRTYDERGNVLTESRAFGSGSNEVNLQTKYTYDAASRVASITYPSGNAVAYGRDAMGRITGATAQPRGASQPATVLSQIGYQPFGPPNGMTYGNGIAETRGFDLDYRLTSLSDAGNQLVQRLSYAYNAANDVLSITDAITSANSQSFGYDPLDRLTSATGSYGNLAYTYDASGNRLTENPTAPISLDGLGSITSFAYNQAGQLVSTNAGAQQLTQYTYDAFGQRLAKAGASTGMSFFQYDRSGHLLAETDNQGNAKADYIYLNGRPVAEYSAGKLYFLHDDRLETPQIATDPTQATVWVGNYQPFGALGASGQTALLGQELRFPGQENDMETGFYHNGFRDYAPELGRYLEPDPLGVTMRLLLAQHSFGSIIAQRTPQMLGNYIYAINNPLIFSDRLGLDAVQDCLCQSRQDANWRYALNDATLIGPLNQVINTLLTTIAGAKLAGSGLGMTQGAQITSNVNLPGIVIATLLNGSTSVIGNLINFTGSELGSLYTFLGCLIDSLPGPPNNPWWGSVDQGGPPLLPAPGSGPSYPLPGTD